MAIQLEFISLVVPRKTIEAKYPGGWEKCLLDHQSIMGEFGRVWFDDHLFRDGVMNPNDMYALLDEWQALGFNTERNALTDNKWTDVCVVEAMFDDSSIPCDWIKLDGASAYLKGTEKGQIVGRPD